MLGFPPPDPQEVLRRRTPSPVMATGGMVCAAHPLVVAAGLDILRAGGNAVDAAVAAGLCAAVVMPEMCGLGGDLFAIVHGPGREPVSFLGSGISPSAATLEIMRAGGEETPDGPRMALRGPLSMSVPGMVDAYAALLARFGSKPLAQLAEPAIGHADKGYPLSPYGAVAIADQAGQLARHGPSAEVFLPGGQVPGVGQVLRQPGLANTLRRICTEGPDSFYRGALAREITAGLAAAGALLSADDFAGHRTVVAPPISTTYRGRTVFQTGLPTQGLILLEALNIIEQVRSADLARRDGAAVHVLAEALKLAYADRLGYARDPLTGPTPLDTLISKAWGRKRFAQLDLARAAEAVPPGGLTDGDTTYLCVVDGQGLMVSLIQSVSSAFGSGVVAGETGVLMNNRVGRGYTLEEGHPNRFVPGRRTMHTLNCWLVADEAGTPVLVGGTPGGDGQPQWNLQVLSAIIDGGLDVQAAIAAPRWTVWPGTDPHTRPNPFELQVETRLGEGPIADLEARGHRIRRMGGWGAGGAAQAIARDPVTGVLCAGSDTRCEGLVLGF